MHDMWNPWHGCHKKSEGCENCYMIARDKSYNVDGTIVHKNKGDFEYPLKKSKNKEYKIRPGETVRICMNSDFLVEEADSWRNDVWEIIKQRPDVVFFILTKRPERMSECLPYWWNDGLDNVIFNVTCENQLRADERIPILFDLPFKHKGIVCAPFIGPIEIEKYLKENIIEQVICDGERYEIPRPLDYNWVKSLSEQCKRAGTRFAFLSTGTIFIKDGKKYVIEDKRLQTEQAKLSELENNINPIKFILKDEYGNILPKDIYIPYFRNRCNKCGSQMVCNGCDNCNKCEK